jgi:hypothetical protein
MDTLTVTPASIRSLVDYGNRPGRVNLLQSALARTANNTFSKIGRAIFVALPRLSVSASGPPRASPSFGWIAGPLLLSLCISQAQAQAPSPEVTQPVWSLSEMSQDQVIRQAYDLSCGTACWSGAGVATTGLPARPCRIDHPLQRYPLPSQRG